MDKSWVWFAEIVPVGILALFLYYDRWQRQRRRERPPVEEKLLRPPGHGLSCEIEKFQDRISLCLAIATACSMSFSVVLFRPRNASEDFPMLIMMGLTALVSAVMIVPTVRRMRHLRLGLLGEQVVAEQLQNLVLKGYHVFHDVPGDDRWNIDHVAVGPAGVFALETKCRTKKSSKNELREQDAVFDGKVIRYPWCEDRTAVEQARRNAKWIGNLLTKATGERVAAQPIVALPGWWVTLTANSDVKVLSGKQVPGFIASQPAVLTPKQITQITHQLDQRSRTVEF